MSEKVKLGMKLFQNEKTPAFIKKLVYKRWALLNRLAEKKIRKTKKDNLFAIPFYNQGELIFELPIINDLISNNIIIKKTFFEFNYLDSIKSLLTYKSVIFDVGANIGNHTLFFSKMNSNNTVYSFEPVEKVYNVLKNNIAINHFKNTKCFQLAIGHKEGTGYIAYDGQTENNLGASRVSYCTNGTIKFDTVDHFSAMEKVSAIDLIKIDVEGSELKVLAGMSKAIDLYNPYIWIEVLKDNKEEAFLLFKQLGLTTVSLGEFNQYDDYLLKKTI